jgi:uncharacterized membrane protein YcaP (DUF421 family)
MQQLKMWFLLFSFLSAVYPAILPTGKIFKHFPTHTVFVTVEWATTRKTVEHIQLHSRIMKNVLYYRCTVMIQHVGS